MAKRANAAAPLVVDSPAVESVEVNGAYPSGCSTFQTDGEFWPWLQGYPDKRGLSGYLYRVRPKIDTAKVLKPERPGARVPTHIEKILDPQKLTLEHIRSVHGGGKFKLQIVDANRRGDTQAAVCQFEVTDLRPILDPRMLVFDAPENLEYVQTCLLEGSLVRLHDGTIRAAFDPEVRDLILRTSTPAPEPAAAAAAAAPADPLSTLRDVFVEVVRDSLSNKRAALAAPASQESSELQKVALDVLRETLKARRNPEPAAAPVDSLGQVSKLFEQLKALGIPVSFGPGAGAAGPAESVSWVERIGGTIQGIFREAPNLAKAAVILKSAGFFGAGAAAPGAPGQVVAPAVLPSASLAPAAGGETAAPAFDESAAVALVSELQTLPGGENVLEIISNPQLLQTLMRITPKALAAFAGGTSGFDFAGWLCNGEPGGLDLYRALERLQPETLAAMATRFGGPSVAGAEMKLAAWFSDFIDFDPDAAAADDGQAGEGE